MTTSAQRTGAPGEAATIPARRWRHIIPARRSQHFIPARQWQHLSARARVRWIILTGLAVLVAAGVTATIVLTAGSSGGGGNESQGRPGSSPAATARGSSTPPGSPAANPSHPAVPAASHTCAPGGNAPESWLLSSQGLESLRQTQPAVFSQVARSSNLMVTEPPQDTSPAGATVGYFSSYAALTTAISRGTIAAGTHWLIFDDEAWPQTPVAEQRDPGRYEALFARLAHEHGFKVIMSPAQDLVPGDTPAANQAGRGPWQKYLSMQIPADAARVADIYEVQAQEYESGPYRAAGVFSRFMQAVVAQAKAANPDVVIFAGLSTAHVSSAAQLTQDFAAARSEVAGFWLNLPDQNRASAPQLASQFLGSLPAPAKAAGRTCARS